MWVVDRGIAGKGNIEFLWEGERCYVVETAKNSVRKFERDLLDECWRQVHWRSEDLWRPTSNGGQGGVKSIHVIPHRSGARNEDGSSQQVFVLGQLNEVHGHLSVAASRAAGCHQQNH